MATSPKPFSPLLLKRNWNGNKNKIYGLHLCPPCHNTHKLHTGILPSGPIPQKWPQEPGRKKILRTQREEGGDGKIQWTRFCLCFAYTLFVGQKTSSCNRQQQTMCCSIYRIGTALWWIIVWLSPLIFSPKRFFSKFNLPIFCSCFSSRFSICALDCSDWRHRCVLLLHFCFHIALLRIRIMLRGKYWKNLFFFFHKEERFL